MSAEWKLILTAPIDATRERTKPMSKSNPTFPPGRANQRLNYSSANGAVALLKMSFVPLFRPSFERIRIDRSIKRATADRNMRYTECDMWNAPSLRLFCCLAYLLCTEGKFYEPRGTVHTLISAWLSTIWSPLLSSIFFTQFFLLYNTIRIYWLVFHVFWTKFYVWELFLIFWKKK